MVTTHSTTCCKTCPKELVSALITPIVRFEPPLSPFYHPKMLKHGKSKLLLVTGAIQVSKVIVKGQLSTSSSRCHQRLSSFVDGKENANGSTSSSMSSTAVVSHQLPENTAPAVANKCLSLEKSEFEANVYKTQDVQCPASIMPSGTFQGCSFTFNINK